MAANGNGRDDFFLPNFCDLRMVFAVVVLSELLAFVLTFAALLPGLGLGRFWGDLALNSLFTQWVGLAGAMLLCVLRRPLSRLGNVPAGILSYLLLLALILLLTELAFRVTGNDDAVLRAYGHRDFLLRNMGIGIILSGLALRYFYVQHQWKQRLKAESEARLEALQARIRPHFLFNTMNTIASLTRSRPEAAEAAIEDLSDLFRASIGDERGLIPLAEELDLAQRYLSVERLRLGERLQVEWSVETLPGDALLPPLTLQPLLENAVYHGIEPRAEGGVVRVVGSREAERWRIEVTNPLAPSGRASHQPGNRMALENIRQRLQAHFGLGCIEAAPLDGQFRVVLTLPYRTGPL